MTQSLRAGITFPVGRIGRYMRKGSAHSLSGGRVGRDAPVFMAAVMEYICAEILEIAGNATTADRRKQMMPRHIELACRNDAEFSRFFQNKTFFNGGTTPYVDNRVMKHGAQGKRHRDAK